MKKLKIIKQGSLAKKLKKETSLELNFKELVKAKIKIDKMCDNNEDYEGFGYYGSEVRNLVSDYLVLKASKELNIKPKMLDQILNSRLGRHFMDDFSCKLKPSLTIEKTYNMFKGFLTYSNKELKEELGA